ncbi:phosphate transport system regulatory protein PhoU [Robertmurraya siralis]|uniref:Phosphate-specific transport system accessory protein PhoU n=1 Tax=Robertmurraya siralis TaxID=77777 RepID=A0A919WES3_9BACI|nr:phosphate signaling complex protein PhoU [Robertmurraya siralis]PAE21820.1 phosphate transport system regulatory protein PhoU [Bacillus sp. 7504-2]GIN60462.1 phosphate transport system regulatory protein PhoU [Robertmurraya siralis]
MVVREQFQLDLNELQAKLLELGRLANQALENSIEALETCNLEKALKVIDDDSEADALYEEINDFAILLIAKQAPVAIDLRRIIVAIKIATDIERIGDFAVNIAKSTIRIGNEEHVRTFQQVKKMYSITTEMLNLSLQAFGNEDVVSAKKVADMDDEVDELYGSSIRELLELHRSHPDNISQITQLSFVCRYLERAADHVTNIAESIFYLVKGRHYDLNA